MRAPLHPSGLTLTEDSIRVTSSYHIAPNFGARWLCIENTWEAQTLGIPSPQVEVMSAGGGYAREGNGARWRTYKVVTFCVDAEFTLLSTLCTHHAIITRNGGLGP